MPSVPPSGPRAYNGDVCVCGDCACGDCDRNYRGDAQAGLNGVSAKIATGFAIFGSTGVDLAEVTRTGSGVFADVFINVIRRIQARITVDVDGGVFSLEFNRRGGVGHAHH